MKNKQVKQMICDVLNTGKPDGVQNHYYKNSVLMCYYAGYFGSTLQFSRDPIDGCGVVSLTSNQLKGK